MTPTDLETLEALGEDLRGVSWHAQIRTDGGERLRVWDESIPELGETVFVVEQQGVRWFRASVLLAPCTDIPGAMAALERGLGGIVRALQPAEVAS